LVDLFFKSFQKNAQGKEERWFNHYSTGTYWNELDGVLKRKFGALSALVMLIMFADKTHHKHKNFWPMMVTLANLPTPYRKLIHNKLLLGTILLLLKCYACLSF
jgi:hypothetical protein